MTGTTRGHRLLAAWLLTRYGQPARRTRTAGIGPRPAFPAIREFVGDLNVELAKKSERAVASAYSVYDWLADAKHPQRPGDARRVAIEKMSCGAVPARAWEEMDEAPADETEQAAS